ncbi:MAG: Uma2 family endonuclease [Microcoleus sp. SIO2G3]|nr:Uma2 family endonuclease [Microcoleus sp. SIO2G3]
MTTSPTLPQNFVTDTWVKVTWEEFMRLAYDPIYKTGKAYYNRGKARIEMTPLGWNHAEDNTIISNLVNLFCAVKRIPVRGLTNCSLRKTGLQEAQPDISFYITSLDNIPPRSNSPVDLNKYAPPSLVVEMAASSLSDDLGEKRLLYEQMNVQEYWVVDVNLPEVTAFAVADSGSRQIDTSQVLPGLTMALIKETLERSRSEEHGAITRWLLSQFS